MAVTIRPLLAGEYFDSDDRTALFGVDGSQMATVGMAPKLLLNLAVRKVTGGQPQQEIFTRAGEYFAETELNGETPDQYCRRAVLASGRQMQVIVDGLTTIRAGLATFAATNAAELPAPIPGVHWVPKGRTLGVVAPANHPEPHLVWVRALSLGYGVIVRPGMRDPFTPARLAAALLAAGLPESSLALLPCDHGVAEALLTATDRGISYGGADTVRRWTGDPRVLIRGPGRSTVLLDVPPNAEIVAAMAHSVAADGGVRCTNTSVIRTSQKLDDVADALAAQLDTIPVLPALHPDAALPAFASAQAETLRQHLARFEAQGFRCHTAGGSFDNLVPLPDGSYAARPLVLSTTEPHHPLVGTELPFPLVVVTPWAAADGVRAIGSALVLSIFSENATLAEHALREPAIRRVVVGVADPWTSAPGLPHDGSLTAFLLEPKALLRKSGCWS